MAGTMAWGGTEVKRPRTVSMESGLDGRNNPMQPNQRNPHPQRLNGVRPRWPEQWRGIADLHHETVRLNGVRPRWPEQLCLTQRKGIWIRSLNGVRPRWPEQCARTWVPKRCGTGVSMESGLDGRNNHRHPRAGTRCPWSLNGVRPRWPEQSARTHSPVKWR